MAEIENFYVCHAKYDIIKHFVGFCIQFVLFSPKIVKNTVFIQKWHDQLLLMMSYLVTIATDSHQTCVKMRVKVAQYFSISGQNYPESYTVGQEFSKQYNYLL